jgi:hypothetical protein
MNLRLIVPIALLAACGDDPNTGPVDRPTAERYCELLCEREARCDGDDLQACIDDCVGDVVGWVREDAFIDIVECIDDLACAADDDVCLEACRPTSAHLHYEQRCREELSACGVSGGSLDGACEVTPGGSSSGDAGFVCLIATPIVQELTRCFDEPNCEAIATCFERVIDRHGIGF